MSTAAQKSVAGFCAMEDVRPENSRVCREREVERSAHAGKLRVSCELRAAVPATARGDHCDTGGDDDDTGGWP